MGVDAKLRWCARIAGTREGEGEEGSCGAAEDARLRGSALDCRRKFEVGEGPEVVFRDGVGDLMKQEGKRGSKRRFERFEKLSWWLKRCRAKLRSSR
jgi:hypothetical protein